MLYDYIVLGAGSGGIASARRAASYGKRVAIVENSRLGGTCVNVGCVPKKVMWNTSAIQEALHEAQHYGFTVGKTDFNWSLLKEKRDAYVQRLNGIYEANLKKDGIDIYHGTASFLSNNQVKVSGVKDVTLDGSHVLIATGSRAWIPDTPGATLGLTNVIQERLLTGSLM